MFKKFMAKIGVGAAKVDLVLDRQHIELGDLVEGHFRVQGGAVEQKINKISADLVIQVKAKDRYISQAIASIPVSSGFTIGVNEEKVLPFSYRLPQDLLISRSGVSYTFQSKLDIAGGVDGSDHDAVKVLPPARFLNLIRALELLGFQEKYDSGKFNGHTQEFEFAPTTHFKGQVQEIEFEAALDSNGIRLLLEVDMYQFFGFSEKELRQELYFSNEQLEDVDGLSRQLQSIITEMLDNPQAYPASRYKVHGHGYRGHRGHGLTGAMGGFAAGIIGGLVVGALMEESVEAFAGEDVEGGEEDGGLGDFFGGDEDF